VRRPRAVVDTSVLMSQHRHAVYLLARPGYFDAVWSPYIVAELTRIRVERSIQFGVDRGVYRERINRLIFLLSGAFRSVNYIGHVANRMKRDPDDEPILATALAAGASYVVSLNTRHFPDNDVILGVRFITPNDFVSVLESRSRTAAIRNMIDGAGSQIP
jgi:predicted nucleic acid-binding protein